jgi:hypothetical protein
MQICPSRKPFNQKKETKMQAHTTTSLHQIIAAKCATRLTRDQAADYLGLKPSTLATDATTKQLNIPFYKIGSKVFYELNAIAEWEQQQRGGKSA